MTTKGNHMTSKNVSKVQLADCSDDGGKWAIYCEHTDANGEPTFCGVLQDTNKQRLATWRNVSNEWCDMCIHEEQGGNAHSFYHPHCDCGSTTEHNNTKGE